MAKKKDALTRLKDLLKAVLLPLLVLLLLLQMFQLWRFSHRIAFIDELEEMTVESVEDVEEAKGYLMSFAGDLNEIREFLLMPTTEYDFGLSEEGQLESTSSDEEDLTVQLFTLVEQLAQYEENQELYLENEAVMQAYVDSEWTAPLSLEAAGGGVYNVTHSDYINSQLLRIELMADGSFETEDYAGLSLSLEDATSVEELQTAIVEWIDANQASYEEGMTLLTEFREYWDNVYFPSAEFQALLTENNFSLTSPLVDGSNVHYELQNADGTWVVDFILDAREFNPHLFMNIDFEDGNPVLTLDSPEDTAGELAFALDEVDTRTTLEWEIDEFKREMDNLMADEGFESTMDRLGYSMEGPEETEQHINYMLMDGEDVLRVIFIDKTTGEIYVGTPEEEGVETLSQANENLSLVLSGKKKLWTCLA